MRLDNISKISLACILVIALLGTGGVAYAGLAHTMDVTGTVQACYNVPNPPPPTCYGAIFLWGVSNDNGVTENQGGYTPIDVGDNGLDPSSNLVPYSPTDPQNAGQTCPRYDKNVAKTTAAVSGCDSDTLTVTLNNAYPYYHPTVFFGIKNKESTSGTIKSVEIINDNPLDLTVQLFDISVGQVINPCATAIGRVNIQLEQAAKQNWTYCFQIKITLEGNCLPPDKDGTPGFWKNSWDRYYSCSQMLNWLKQIDIASNWIYDPSNPTRTDRWTINDMYTIIDNGNGSNSKAQFLKHYLCFRLNVKSGRLSSARTHNITGVSGYLQLGLANPSACTVLQIQTAIESKYSLGNSAPFDIMKNVCDGLNNLWY